MPELRDHYRFRDELIQRLESELLGPVAGTEEILLDPPATAYLTGVLYPRSPEESAERDDDHGTALLTVDEQPDTGVALANVQAPSAMGMTFVVDLAITTSVLVQINVAAYIPIDENGHTVPARRAEKRSTEEAKIRWRRRPLIIDPVRIDVTVPKVGCDPSVTLPPGLELRRHVRRPEDRLVTVTLTLINNYTIGYDVFRDPYCFFQPEFKVTAPNGTSPFAERTMIAGAGDADGALSRLLHRHAPMFATGHGCAVDWMWTPHPVRDIRSTAPARTASVWTTFVPRYEVFPTASNPDVEELGMRWLSAEPQSEIITALSAMTAGYRAWIEERDQEIPELEPRDQEIARRQLSECRGACRRMERGIALLDHRPSALEAFRLANEAMAAQRGRTAWMRSGRIGRPDIDEGRWRPFQIGFLLLCLEGIVDTDHDDREIADLLWFPTGGGKTEAYLGLIAFTIFYRRLSRGAAGGGVTVLMRYTLRLLTLQQFERAATLMCAMETMRRRDPARLGEEPMSIGMWVGRSSTPNWLEEAKTSIDQLCAGKKVQERNPVQLRACAWCGTPMDANDYHVDLAAGSMTIRCSNIECDFVGGIPVHVVDEAIYRVRPSLIIATADKFAQIAWREQVANLFNLAGAPPGTPPPELIIQDELHLISGPLGTLAGLYESAIDLAADRPKIIASTATIRRAEDQGRHLFNRTIRQFPPAGLDARDSWFAIEVSRARKAARSYVGVLTSNTSQATLLIRTYAALLHHAQLLESDVSVRDAYWTLVGYFNSMRLLAAAELQVHADVDERLKQLALRDGAHRTIEVFRELTSRVDSSDIPQRLAQLFVAHPDQAAIDVVLATNMISVGVDVERLGLMAVMGQPQTTAEYIQATSRIGRRHPGLAVAMFNSARSRDRSHYENFVSYHSALYRQVESTSVTPFAARARDRALHAVLVGLVRMCIPELRSNDSARLIFDHIDEVDRCCRRILARIEVVAPAERRKAEEEIEYFIDRWKALADRNHNLVYEAPRKRYARERRHPDTALLGAYGTDDDLEDAWETMWSLRDVDVESDLYLER